MDKTMAQLEASGAYGIARALRSSKDDEASVCLALMTGLIRAACVESGVGWIKFPAFHRFKEIVLSELAGIEALNGA